MVSLVIWAIVGFGLLTLVEGRYDARPLFPVIVARRPLIRIPDALRARRCRYGLHRTGQQSL
jgi:hypothetical protein